MKIIKKGTIDPFSPLWWTERDFRCRNCDTIVRMEPIDETKKENLFKQFSVMWHCPVCSFDNEERRS